MKKTIVVIALIVVVYLMIGKISVRASKTLIPNEAIRLRILANSDSVYDQNVKAKVKSELQNGIAFVMQDVESLEGARDKIKKSIPYLEEIVANVLNQENNPYSYQLDFGIHSFPEKEYKGVLYEAGDYESLLVTLGEGKGQNWWCVLFPPLCLLEAEESSDVEYQFFLKELLEKYF